MILQRLFERTFRRDRRHWRRIAVGMGLALVCSAGTVFGSEARADAPGATALPGAQLGANLIVNGDAESGTGAAASDDPLMDIPGWTREGNFQVMQYGASGGFPGATDPGPKERGKNFFVGGPGNAESSASQKIDVSTLAPVISQGRVSFTFAAYLGGYGSQGDHAYLAASFEDRTGKVLKVAGLGPVTAVQRSNVTGLLPVSSSGIVPPATTTVVIFIKTVRTDGAFNDGSADNLSLVFQK